MNNSACSNDLCRGILPEEGTEGIAIKPENYLTINPGGGGGVGGGVLNKFLHGEAPPRGPTPIYHFSQKRYRLRAEPPRIGHYNEYPPGNKF